MFKHISFTDRHYDDWNDRYSYDFVIQDTDFVANVRLTFRCGVRCGRYRDAFMTAISTEYRRRALNVAKNAALFYVWYFNNFLTKSQKLMWNMRDNLLHDTNYIDSTYATHAILFRKSYLRCLINQIKIMQYCNKLPKQEIFIR